MPRLRHLRTGWDRYTAEADFLPRLISLAARAVLGHEQGVTVEICSMPCTCCERVGLELRSEQEDRGILPSDKAGRLLERGRRVFPGGIAVEVAIWRAAIDQAVAEGAAAHPAESRRAA